MPFLKIPTLGDSEKILFKFLLILLFVGLGLNELATTLNLDLCYEENRYAHMGDAVQTSCEHHGLLFRAILWTFLLSWLLTILAWPEIRSQRLRLIGLVALTLRMIYYVAESADGLNMPNTGIFIFSMLTYAYLITGSLRSLKKVTV